MDGGIKTSYTSHFLEGKTIIVAGGGIAGSAFVAGLRRLWDPRLKPPTVVIYERDAKDVTAQRAAYTLSLSGLDDNGGLVTLKKLGLLSEALGHAVSGLDGTGSLKIWDPDWKEHMSLCRKPIPGIPASSIRIGRAHLRQVLHDAADPDEQDIIEWETQCVSATQLPDGRIRVRVLHERGARETEEECDLLVAADGANSKLRQCLRPNDTLKYTGAVLRGGVARFDGPIPAPLGQDWGFVMSRTGISCFLSPVDKHSVVWALGHAEGQVPCLDRRSAGQAQAVISRGLELGSHFQEPFQTIVKRTDPETVLYLNGRDKQPFFHTSIAETPVVFIGDSNHAVGPFAGYGANLALSDGWDLAEQICKSKLLSEAVAAYDKLSVPRATRILKGSRRRLKAGHSTGWRYHMFWCMLFVGKFVGWIMRKMKS